MYAKLSYSSNVASALLIRDIVRLVTNATPNTSMISGFANSSSFIVDATPAGWTYVNSNIDGATLQPASNTLSTFTSNATSGTWDWWAISAPCVNTSITKYAKLTSVYWGNTATHSGFSLTGATSISGNTVTNEGTRAYAGGTTSFQSAVDMGNFGLSGTYHVIANPQHITIIKESQAISAVWEHSTTEYHTGYGITPILQFNCSSANASVNAAPIYKSIYSTVGTAGQVIVSPGALSSTAGTLNVNLFNITDTVSGTNYGTLSLGDPLNSTIANNYSVSVNPYIFPMSKGSTIGSTGLSKNLVNPVLFQAHAMGVPTTYVTGVTPVYMTKGGLGAAGDTMTINGVSYTYFPCGQNVSNSTVTNSSLKNFGVLMLTY